MRYFKISVMLIIAYVVQTAILSKIRIGGVVTNLVLAILVCFSLKEENFLKSGILAAAAGLAVDASAGTIMGFNSLLCMGCAMICSLFGVKFFKGKFGVVMIFVFVISILYETVYYIFAFAIWYDTNLIYCFIYVILPTALINVIAAAIVYKPIDRITK